MESGSKDIRDVLKIAKLSNAVDTEEDIKRLISAKLAIENTIDNYVYIIHSTEYRLDTLKREDKQPAANVATCSFFVFT